MLVTADLLASLLTSFDPTGLHDTPEGFFLFVLCIFLVTMAASATCFLMAVTFQTFAAAQLIMSVIYVMMILFSGYMVNLSTIGDWFSWIQYISIVKYGIAALYVNELKDRTFCDSNGTFCKEGNEFLWENSIDYESTWDFWFNYFMLFLLTVVLFALTYVQLRRMVKIH